MKNRNIFAVLLLPMVTFGIYALVWLISTKNEMNKLGAKIPTALLLFIPIANLFWIWNYAQGVEIVTNGKMSAITSLLLIFFLGAIGYAIIQNEFNDLGAVVDSGTTPMVSDPTVMTAAAIDQTVVTPSFTSEAPVVATSGFVEQPTFDTQAVVEQPAVESIDQYQAAPTVADSYQPTADTMPEMTMPEQVSDNNEA